MAALDVTTVHLEPIDRKYIEVAIEGITPVIPHRWSEKARRGMRIAQSGPTARKKHEPKDAEAEAEAALYRLSDGRPGIPAPSFKAATVGGVRLYAGLTMVSIKPALFIHGEGPDQLVPVEGELTMREDMPRNSGGTVDLRYRYQIWPWTAVLRVEYLPVLIDEVSVVRLVDAGGNGGVGDWRPSAPKSLNGNMGRYRVAGL